MFRILLLCTALLAQASLSAQDFNNYKPLRAQGEMPAKFITSSTEKFKKDLEKKLSDRDKGHVRKAKEKFLMESNFGIDQLLLSGKVLFNDPVTLYVNKVLDEVLKDMPKLRKEIEVYVVKSPAVNAFATDNGIILVNIGLIAHLESEAELAFVLSHEVIHYQKQHSLDEYVENTKIEKGKGAYRGSSVDERLLARSNYSKEKESEADLEGLKIFLKSNYSLEAVSSAFGVLAYAHLPYADTEFSKTFLERGNLLIPQDYWLDKTDSMKAEDEDDSLSSHPAVNKRRQAAEELLTTNSNQGRKDFIVNEQEFYNVRKICRFESTEQFIQNRDFEPALYNSYLLLKEEPASAYLKKSIFEALYGLAKYANGSELSDVHTDPDDISGSSQRLYHFIDKVSSAELSLVALVNGWDLKNQYPEDKRLAAQVSDIFKETVKKHYPDRSFFSTSPRPAADTTVSPEETEADVSSEEEAENKATKKKKKKKKKKKESDLAKYALTDLLRDSAFVAQYEKIADEMDKEEARSGKLKKARKNSEVTEAEVTHVFEGSAGREDDGEKGSISRLIVVNPTYYFVMEKGSKGVKYTKSEAGQQEFSLLVQDMMKRVGIKYSVLDNKNLDASSTDAFNEIAALNAYLDQTADDGDKNLMTHLHPELQSIREKYKTRYVCWTGAIGARVVDEALWDSYVACCQNPLFLPIFIYKAIAPNYRTYFFTLVMDLETGETAYSNAEAYGMIDAGDVMKGTLYQTFKAIKTKSKKK